ncbi:TonB-dependent receptor [Novosphingobium malaysiense]|uniref:TonB-dependent receptor n=1 Tax=Novosphingobium malaysiense TaxID=1348853 RepID=A0A0B1ZWU4_9SPHN|nr:TonB-dependent receptor [Novosphingobium malaysiense]
MVLANAALPGIAFAQDGPASDQKAVVSSEIIVTAQRREELSRDVPITVTTLGTDQLTTANANSLADISKLSTSLRFDSQGTFVQPTIRGVGTTVTTTNSGPNVGIYVDGFFQSNPEVADFQLLRVKSIQVLKGPQGTLFGRNTTGGAILITTDEPSTTTAAQFKASYGRFNTLTLQGYATTGLSDNVAVDIEGLYRKGDGFQDSIYAGYKHPGAFENWSVRAGIKADLSDSISVLVRYTHSSTDDPTALMSNAYVDRSGAAGIFDKVSPTGMAIYQANFFPTASAGQPLLPLYLQSPIFGFSVGNLIAGGLLPPDWSASDLPYATKPGDIASLDKISFRNKSDSVQGTVKADLGFADFTSYTQYRKDKAVNIQDLDATAAYTWLMHIGVMNETFSQEFLVNSKPGSRLQWTVGLNYFENTDDWDDSLASFLNQPFAPFGGASAKAKSYAAFADLTYAVTPRLFITVGGRYSHDLVTDAYFRNSFTNAFYEDENGDLVPLIAPDGTYLYPPGTAFPLDTLKNDSFTPRAVVRFKPSEESSIYASYTRGYKAGMLNVGGLSKRPIKPEKINAYEMGFKYEDRVFSLDLAAYYYDYKDLQVSSFQDGAVQLRNAASSEIYGVEGQLRYKVDSHLSVTAGAAWTHARYKKFPNDPYYSYCDPVAAAPDPLACGAGGIGSLVQTTVDGKGFRMQRAPDFTANLGAAYGFDLGGGRTTFSGNLYYTSKFFFDSAEQFLQKGYATLSLRAQWEDPSQHFTVAVYGDNVTDQRYLTQVQYNTLGVGAVWNAPVTWGVQLGVKY